MVSQSPAKGFSKIPEKPRLIQGWLLPENRSFYRFKNDCIIIESLGIQINSALANASGRNKRAHTEDGLITSGLIVICDIDKELMNKFNIDKNSLIPFLRKLNKDDVFYVAYYNKLLDIVKNDVLNNRVDYTNKMIYNTFEFKRWQKEAGIETVSINLINGWLHPLAEFPTIDGKECMCMWGFASITVAIACGRFPEEGNPHKAITTLIQEGVIDIENYKTHLEVCKYLDSEYLQVVSKFKQILDSKVAK